MAFSYAIKNKTVFGDKRVVIGTYANAGGTTGGDIVTSLSRVLHIELQVTKNAVTNAHVVNETMPLDTSGTVTIVTGADEGGTFMAIGY